LLYDSKSRVTTHTLRNVVVAHNHTVVVAAAEVGTVVVAAAGAGTVVAVAGMDTVVAVAAEGSRLPLVVDTVVAVAEPHSFDTVVLALWCGGLHNNLVQHCTHLQTPCHQSYVGRQAGPQQT